MSTPAHRAPAPAPVPAHRFVLKDGEVARELSPAEREHEEARQRAEAEEARKRAEADEGKAPRRAARAAE
jgi:hypothetical protein